MRIASLCIPLLLAACGGKTIFDGSTSSAGGGGSASGGATGASGGGGGFDSGTTETSCPLNPGESEGLPCQPDGKWCTYGEPDPCTFNNSLLCQGGVWQRMEAHPDPNCFPDPEHNCGGIAGLECANDEWCDMAGCGFDDSLGTCRKKPEGCFTACPQVCGCDGQVYCSECDANQAGVGVHPDADCFTDPGEP